ncbi:cytochrome d ubiquinol oxidase subunit II [Granulicella sp. 5B5]|uniref:cytochrome d ubiquinol oxidase subunit II n=1 Tax=Granulicella sp. 5B5 TaxID=1617967 RepID=UPI0015F3D3BE|nr:cytochrome d ubiquinol oxidase subunit II [Granulicella sp. 5B5]QMV19868.1 cytochrome d ubiquinol oxidase subunit II [Granulicella sp. 5B5]
MASLWFWIVAVMLAAYVVLDGFDLGVGILMPFVARTEEDRQQAIHSIGPVWDGNEVWLIAAGGTLFFAFPLLYASSFSGFYMPLMIVLWLLILRGLSVELRMHFRDPLWRTFFDGLFFFSSTLLAIFFGAALANVVRGVPIGPDNYFYLPLWTNWRTGISPGILDWYTVIGGVMALLALAMHGALYLMIKTEGHLERRARVAAGRLLPFVALATVCAIPATVLARPGSLNNYTLHPAAFLSPLGVILSLSGLLVFMRKHDYLRAFFCSCTYLIAMLCGAAAGLYPVLLPTTIPGGQSITVANAIAGPHTLRVGLVWWTFGTLLAILYFSIVYWLFRGKVSQHEATYGH